MMFETMRWGIPNLAAVVALAVMPLLSLVVSNERHAAPLTIAMTLDAPEALNSAMTLAE